MSTTMKPIYVELEALSTLLTLSVSTIQSMVRGSEFPKPRQLSGRRVAWLLREIEAWAEERPVSDLPPPPNTGSRKGFKTAPAPQAEHADA
jgi:prophage regulatory protein